MGTRVVVTGAAGFIGSHLTEALLRDGHSVVGIDAFTDYYDPACKHANLAEIGADDRFELVGGDLCDLDLPTCFDGVDTVFHLAGQPGVRASWREGFAVYLERNVLATQRLLEACVRASVRRVTFASSSSVYGNARRYPTNEQDLPAPYSPYGVTKLAAEHLANLYAANFALYVTSVRYFTVYGPRQRPDMAIHRMITAAREGTPFPLFGDGSQRRDFTFVADAVDATRLAAEADVAPGSVYNVGGGSDTSVTELLDIVGQAVGRPVPVDPRPAEPGDATRTGADTAKARSELGWAPRVELRRGVSAQAEHLAAWA